jgi:hypothetical protein
LLLSASATDWISAVPVESLAAGMKLAGSPKSRGCIVRGRDLVMRYMIESTEYTTRVADHPRNELDLLRRVKAEVCDRLTDIGRSDRERFEREGELQWQIAADSHQLIRNEELANGS